MKVQKQKKYSTLCMLGNFACFFVVCWFCFFLILPFSKLSFRNTITECQNIRPDLGPNCLQRLSADDKSHHYIARKEFKQPSLLQQMT